MFNRILFLFILILLNAFFAGSEIALISLNDSKIKMLAEKGDKKAKQLNKILSEPSRFLATIQIGITLVGFLASAFAAESFADPVVNYLGEFNLPLAESLLKVITVVVITVILSYFTLVLGELVPKRVAMKKAESISFAVITPLTVLSKFANPFVKLLTASTNFGVRLFGIDPHSIDDDVTEEEIRMMIDIGEERGAIEEHEKIMINNIFEFNNKTAEDVMTHRMEITGVPNNIRLDELIEVFEKDHYSRIPVYEDNIDNIIGILHVKDLISLLSSGKVQGFNIESFLRKPVFTPVKKQIDELFLELQETKMHMAVVIDEYGGTAGIVTIEDLIEEIFGNIFDEYDKEDDLEFKQVDEAAFEVKGTISLGELENYLDIELPTEDYDTLNGFLIGLFGNVPPQDRISETYFNELLIQTVEVSDKRIEKVLIRIQKQPSH